MNTLTITKKAKKQIKIADKQLDNIIAETALNELNLNLNQPLKPHKDDYTIGNIQKMNNEVLEYLGFNRGKDEDEEQYKRKKVDNIKNQFRTHESMQATSV